MNINQTHFYYLRRLLKINSRALLSQLCLILGLNSCAALRKLASEHKDWSDGKGHDEPRPTLMDLMDASG